MTRFCRASSLWMLALLVGLAAGCQDDREATYTVRGVVRFSDGSPVPYGVVESRSEVNGRIARGLLDQSGHFTLGTYDAADGAVAGKHRAIVIQPSPPEMLGQRQTSQISDTSQHAAHGAAQFVSLRYSQYSTTPLTIDVATDKPTIVELVVDPLPPSRFRN